MNKNIKNDTIIARIKNQKSFLEDKFGVYPIQQLLIFFEKTKKINTYLSWLISSLKKLRKNKDQILEINDLNIDCSWDEEMHKRLIGVQRKKFPGIITPLVDKIFEEIKNNPKQNISILNFGSGGMELEKQIIEKLVKDSILLRKNIFFVGIDTSEGSRKIGKENLAQIEEKIEIIETNILDEELFKSNKGIRVILSGKTPFVDENHPEKPIFDIILTSLFMHHLKEREQNKLRDNFKLYGEKVFEYDGYHKLISYFVQAIEAWGDPIFLNASIFSILRYNNKNIIKKKKFPKVKFFIKGFYLATLK